jgi:glycosyltransferase involved in cell wall biosynthesis
MNGTQALLTSGVALVSSVAAAMRKNCVGVFGELFDLGLNNKTTASILSTPQGNFAPIAKQDASCPRRVAVVGTVGLPPQYGGFETLAHFLVLYLGNVLDFTVYCSGPEYQNHAYSYHGARLKYFPFNANGAQSVIFDCANLIHGCFSCDVLLVLGCSGGIFLPFTRLFRKRVVLNIGGVEWKRSKWGPVARHFLKLSEAIAVRCADVLVADNQGIACYLKKEYGLESTLIEYGGDQISLPPITDETRQRYAFLNAPFAFSLARIQADNNIEMVLEAFAQSPSHPLVLVGNWARSDYGRELKDRFEHYPNLHLLEAIYDQEELNCLRGHCALYIHGHSAGGTNPALVEAMHLSLPIAAFDVIYNRATTEDKAYYFRSADELKELIRQVSAADWGARRLVMKGIAERRYRWKVIAGKYAEMICSRSQG